LRRRCPTGETAASRATVKAISAKFHSRIRTLSFPHQDTKRPRLRSSVLFTAPRTGRRSRLCFFRHRMFGWHSLVALQNEQMDDEKRFAEINVVPSIS
jgi:hypothetical protein